MIDFEEEIEIRLREFQRLTGKGSIKEGNHTLYEIIRLMLGMMSQLSVIPAVDDDAPTPDDDDDDASNAEDERVWDDWTPSEPADVGLPETVAGEHIEISSVALAHPPHLLIQPDASAPAPAQKPTKAAPNGLTKFGNPRRIRKPKKKN